MATSPIDPAQPSAVRGALSEHLNVRLGRDVTFAEAPETVGRGFDTHIYAFRLSGRDLEPSWSGPLILRLYRSPGEAEKAARDAAVQRFVFDAGFPTPRIVADGTPGSPFGLPFIIMERAPGRIILERITSRPLAARRVLAQMAALHVRLHRLPPEGCPLPSDGPLIGRQLERVGLRIENRRLHELQGGLELRRLRSIAEDEQLVLCHGDFHPLNVVAADDGRMAVLDWTDAALGDRHYDVARTVTLFSFAHIAAERAAERIVLRAVRRLLRSWYFRPYDREMPVEPERLRYWEAFHAFQALLQLHELDLDRASGVGSNPEAVRRLPTGLRDEVQRYFERKMRAVESGVTG